MALVRDLLRQHVHHPERDDGDDRHHDDDHPGHHVGRLRERLAFEEGGMCRQGSKLRDERDREAAPPRDSVA
jgi:hypothetical protein